MGENNEDSLKALLDMGFDEETARKALEKSEGNPERALDSLVKSENDMENEKASGPKSYRCTDTGQVFRSLRDAQIYAEKTGNQNFEEIDQLPPLTEEEKKEQVRKLRDRIEAKKKERQEKEKVEERQKELKRRKEGQNMLEVREEMEKQSKERYYELKKKEKAEDKKRREELKELIARDKAERAAAEAEKRGEDPKDAYDATYAKYRPQAGQPISPEQIMDKSIDGLKAVYEVGGKKSLSILSKIIGNILDNPDEEKFRSIKFSNKTFKNNVSKFQSAMKLLQAAGFQTVEEETEKSLVLKQESYDDDLLHTALSKIKSALT